jgi:AcrR family transcriptional regulator
MAVAFTEAERDHITESLVETAERLFAQQGLRKTSLDELAAPAGIAKSSFYAFFDSKEALYLEVMIRRAPAVGRIVAAALDQEPGAEALAALMRASVHVLSTDPFYRRLLTHPDELRAVQRRVGAHEVDRVAPYAVTPILDFLRRGQRAGAIEPDVEPEVLLGVLRTVGLIVLHRDEMGEHYERILDTTIQALAAGMTRRHPPSRRGVRRRK